MSFGPFLGGKRICLGKTFAEVISKIIGTTMLHEFDYEFVDAKNYEQKEMNNFGSIHQPVVMVKVRESQKFY